MYLLSWLRRLTSLNRLTWFSALFVFVFLFVGVPMLGPAVEMSGAYFFGNDPVANGIYFGAVTVVTGFIAMSIVSEARLFDGETEKGYMLPAPVKRLVMLSSESLPPAALCDALLTTTDRYTYFDMVKRGKLGRGGWFTLILRAMEHHREALLQLVFIVSDDGLGADHRAGDRGRLEKLVLHYASLAVKERPDLSFHHIEVGFRRITFGVGFEETRQVCDMLQEGIAAEDVVFDFTPGTKPMSTGMVMACLDERYDLQYFMPLGNAIARKDAIRHAKDHLARLAEGVSVSPLDPRTVGWGLLDIEIAMKLPIEDGGVMPLRIQTDPRPVLYKVDA